MKTLKFCCILLLTLCLAACFEDAPANTPAALVSAEQPAPQAIVPAQLPAPVHIVQPAAPQIQVVNQAPSAYDAWLAQDLALKQQALEHSQRDADMSARHKQEEHERKTTWGNRFFALFLLLSAVVGAFALAITGNWAQGVWMDRHPERYHKDELDKLVSNPSPTEAQARMAQAISTGLASRRHSLAGWVAGIAVAVGLVLGLTL